MSGQYHYLIAGLPEILFEENKLPIDVSAFKNLLKENLLLADYTLIECYFWRIDNRNILLKLNSSETAIDPSGNLSEERIQELFEAVKEGSFDSEKMNIPAYLGSFIEAFKADTPLIQGKSWDLQLTELYYQFLATCQNEFIANWFNFERDLSNILSAAQCRKFNIPINNQLIGSDEFIEKLSHSNARDFGIDKDMPKIDAILRIIDEEDLLEYERKIDLIKWEYLDEEVFFYFFTIERLFAFLIKLTIINRWMALDKETGRKLFNKLLNSLESTYDFPEEFMSKK